jgi:hypothetical protein
VWITAFSKQAVPSPSLLALNKKKDVKLLYLLLLAGYKNHYYFCVKKNLKIQSKQ